MRKLMLTIVLICPQFLWADPRVIVAFGDSLTQGYGLPVEDGFVPQMQRWLDSQGADVRLINAGVSGDTTAGALARAAWTLTPEVDGMILAIGANDMLRGLDPAQARANIDGILQAAAAADVQVLLVGMQAQGNFGAQYKAQFEGMYPELAQTHGAAFAESFFVGLMQDGVLPAPVDLVPLLQADGLHPNAQGVALIVEGLGASVLEFATQLAE